MTASSPQQRAVRQRGCAREFGSPPSPMLLFAGKGRTQAGGNKPKCRLVRKGRRLALSPPHARGAVACSDGATWAAPAHGARRCLPAFLQETRHPCFVILCSASL